MASSASFQRDSDPVIRRYSGVAMLLHWAIALLIAFNIGLASAAEDAPRAAAGAIFGLHKPIGITIMLLTVLRLIWRLTHRPPPYPTTLEGWERKLATGVHHSFYLVTLLIPLTGWLYVSSGDTFRPIDMFGIGNWPQFPGAGGSAAAHAIGEAHGPLVYAYFALLLLHIAGALKHTFVDRGNDAARMIPLRPGQLGVGLIGAMLLMTGAFIAGRSYMPAAPALAAPATGQIAADADGDGD